MDIPSVVDENGLGEGYLNPIMPIQGAGQKHPMGQTKSNKLAIQDSKSKSLSNDQSETKRMSRALERKNIVKETTYCHRLWQNQASFTNKKVLSFLAYSDSTLTFLSPENN